MTTAVDTRRAQLVESLWRLKQMLDYRRTEGTGKVHFNRMLHDTAYRKRIIDEGLAHDNRQLRECAQQVSQLDQAGHLAGNTTSGKRQTPPEPPEPQQPAHNRLRTGLIPLLSLGLLMLAAATWALREPIQREWSALMNNRKVVSGTISTDTTWSADATRVLDGIVFVTDNSRLTIEAGTRILGRPGSALVVTRGASLQARGSASRPVVFSSARPRGARGRGDWGGVVLLGSAPVNTANAQVEGIPNENAYGAYGGDNPGDSCGVLTHARIEFAGHELAANNELNGLTLGGCGDGTIVRHVQVHRGLDDGIEVFGGTVDLKHILVTGAGDDSLDWDQGWRGRVQFLIAQQHSATGDNAFEGDNRKGQPDATPRSRPVMYNLSLISPRSRETHHRGMTLRRGTGGEFHNVLLSGFSGETLDLQGQGVRQLVNNGVLTMSALMVYGIGGYGSDWFDDEKMTRDDDGNFDEAHWLQKQASRVTFGVDPRLQRAATSAGHPSFTPLALSPLRTGGVTPPQGEFWDESANWIGAVRPGTASSWLDGWTAFPLN